MLFRSVRKSLGETLSPEQEEPLQANHTVADAGVPTCQLKGKKKYCLKWSLPYIYKENRIINQKQGARIRAQRHP